MLNTVYTYVCMLFSYVHGIHVPKICITCTYIPTYACIIVFTACGLPLVGPPTSQFDYCISYNDGEPALQVISHVHTYSVVIVSA